MTFNELGIAEPILRAIAEKGYTTPTPIQEQSIPILLDRKDLLGCAQTGTGKTAAFSIPIIQHLFLDPKQSKGHRVIRALVVTPTRELAIQVEESFAAYGKYTGLRTAVIFGGVKQNPQVDKLEKGIDILVATPGRLLDLIGQGHISLKHVEFSVLDEADRMLDMGFIHDIKKLIALLPVKRQSLFFSATMPPDIVDLSKKLLGNPVKVSITPEQTTAEKVTQQLYFVGKGAKAKLLVHLLEKDDIRSAIVFSRTKHGANKIVKILEKAEIKAEAIHGNKSQAARQRALSNFTEGSIKVLIATDIAARGIDISQLSHVINYDLPNIPETYVHRIGRTGRASASGAAISFCDDEERPYLKDIQKLIGQSIPVVENHEFSADDDGADAAEEREFGRGQAQRRTGRGQNARTGEAPRNSRNPRNSPGDNPRGSKNSSPKGTSDEAPATTDRSARPNNPRKPASSPRNDRPQGERSRPEGSREGNRNSNSGGERRGNRNNSQGNSDSDNRGNRERREDNREGNRENNRDGNRDGNRDNRDGNRGNNSGNNRNKPARTDGNRYTNEGGDSRQGNVNGNTRNRNNDRQDNGNRNDSQNQSSDKSSEKPESSSRWNIFKWRK